MSKLQKLSHITLHAPLKTNGTITSAVATGGIKCGAIVECPAHKRSGLQAKTFWGIVLAKAIAVVSL